MLIGESNPFCGDRVEEVNTRISSSREVLVVEVPLGGMKMHYEMDTSYSNKELVPFKNLDLMPLSYNYL
jgi:hypothetical protein